MIVDLMSCGCRQSTKCIEDGCATCCYCGGGAREELTPEQELLQAMVPVVEVLMRLIYEHHGAGCCMHIVTDDGNIEDDHVRYCLSGALSDGHPYCAGLAALLLTIPESMRDDAMGVPMGDRGD